MEYLSNSSDSFVLQAIRSSVVFQLLAVCLAAFICQRLYVTIRVQRQRALFEQQNGCKPPTAIYPSRDPFGLTYTYNFVTAGLEARALEWQHQLFQKLGSTFVVRAWHGTTSIWTNDPENVKVLLNKVDQFLVGTSRYEPFKALLGRGIFTSDGPMWHESRGMLRKQFEKSQFMHDLEHFEKHVAKLLTHLEDGGSTIDLQPLFHHFATDTSTEFLTGTCANALDTNEQAEQARDFVRDFDLSMEDAILQARMGRLYKLLPRLKARQANRVCREYIGSFVAKAVEHRSEKSEATDERYTFVTELAREGHLGETRILDETANILLAGRDTTAGLLSHLWFHLARNPSVWKTLQEEVDQLGGEAPSYERLKGLKYLENCTKEALRLQPASPLLAKHAASDTFLPRGGGPNGDEALFVAKGTAVFYNSYSMQRNKEVYGDNADVFRPERWDDDRLRPQYNYIPFGAGPRSCLGQQYGLSEASYATVRMMQKFRRIECRDAGPWQEKLTASLSSKNGTKVALWRD